MNIFPRQSQSILYASTHFSGKKYAGFNFVFLYGSVHPRLNIFMGAVANGASFEKVG